MPDSISQKDTLLVYDTSNLENFKNNYDVLEYLTNTSSLLDTTIDKYTEVQLKELNDMQLSRYYDLKKNNVRRQSSIISGSEYSNSSSKNASFSATFPLTQTNDNNYNNGVINSSSSSSNNSIRTEAIKHQGLVDHFLSCTQNNIEPYQVKRKLNSPMFGKFANSPDNDITGSEIDQQVNFDMGKDLLRQLNNFSFSRYISENSRHNSDNGVPTEESQLHRDDPSYPIDTDLDAYLPNSKFLNQYTDMLQMNFANSYRKYYKKLLTVNLDNTDTLKKHNLWVPMIRDDCKDLLIGDYLRNIDIYTRKTCPLFVKGLDYIPTMYDIFSGCSVMKSFFSEYKFPTLVYHCSITMNKRIFIIGGLMPCYRYDSEAPNPCKYYMEPIKNLPPPLLPEIINNPTLVNSPYLYIYSIDSSRLTRPTPSGHIPPPLLCSTASKLTETHILFYGGFEIRTETKFSKNGKYYLKRSAYLNNTIYILDTVSLHFTKVDVIAQSYKNVKYPTFSARFGHMQVSTKGVKNIGCSTDAGKVGISTPMEPTTSNNSTRNNSVKSDGSIKMSSRESSRFMSNLSNHGVDVYTIVIFGGYRQTGDDKYEAMNDMWKLDIKVVGRGKRNFLKFADTVIAVKIPIVDNSENWPSTRAFFAYDIPPFNITNHDSLQEKILKNLEENFKIEYRGSREHLNTDALDTINFLNVHNRSVQHSTVSHERKLSTTSAISSERSPEGSVSMQRYETTPVSLTTTKVNTNMVSSSSEEYQRLAFAEGSPFIGGAVTSNCNGGRTIVIHGGSNNRKVFGDMWWFNLDEGSWKRVTTYGTIRNDPGKPIPAQMKLVGHSMTSLGYMAVLTGGFSDTDVSKIYDATKIANEPEMAENDVSESNYQTRIVRNSVINIMDLRSHCIQGCVKSSNEQLSETYATLKSYNTIGKNPTRFQEETSPDISKSHLVSSIGGTVAKSEGSLFLIGGLTARRSTLNKMYMRGSLLEFVLPSKSLAS